MVNSVPGTAAGQLIRENCVLSREKEREQSKSHLLKDEIFKIKKKPTWLLQSFEKREKEENSTPIFSSQDNHC